LKKYIISTLFLALSFSVSHAKDVNPNAERIRATSIQIEKNTGDILKGIYTKEKPTSDSDYITVEKLIATKVVGHYDEAVITFDNIKAGIYFYRFSDVSKKGIKVSNWARGGYGGCTNGIESAINQTKDKALSKTKDFMLLSKSGSNVAEIRLTAFPENKIEFYSEVLTIACSDPSLAEKIEWTMTPKPNTDWEKLEVKHAQKLVFRIPKEVSDISKFELVRMK
jgi:hypothetical protein